MKIEKANQADAKEITALTIRSKSHWNYSVEQIESWREELTITAEYISQNEVYKLTEEELIGFYAFNKIGENKVKLFFFFIEPKHIGKGFGKKLMNDFIQRVKKLGFEKVTVDADPNAEYFYSKSGFKIVGQLPSSIKNRFLPIMELYLK